MVAKPISPIISALLAGALALLLSSCYETKQEFTINPDGSGKVRHECSFQSVRINNEDDTSPEALKAAIAKIIADSKGVDAWTDVSFKRLDDGRMWFRGTAYFKKLADLQIFTSWGCPSAGGRCLVNTREHEFGWTRIFDNTQLP